MNLQQALDQLGKDPDTIYRTLVSLGIRGGIMNPSFCPVAQFLMLRGIKSPSVSMTNIIYYMDGKRQIVPTPDAVSEFIRLFDTGKYQQLRVV